LSKPSFLTDSLGRRFLSIAVVSVLTLITAVSSVTASQENGASDRREAFRRLVQSYVQTGSAEYDKRYFAEAEKTFLMAKPYREYLSAAERDQLDALLMKAQTATAERKRALEIFPLVNGLIKQDKLTEAKVRLNSLKASAFLTTNEQAQIAEVLRQLDVQIADDKTNSKAASDRKLLATAKLEKIAEGIRDRTDL
jgi:thioester reductase-like protein